MNIAKVFHSGSDQAIRLPDEFRVDVDEVYLKRTPEEFLVMSRDPWKTALDPRLTKTLTRSQRPTGGRGPVSPPTPAPPARRPATTSKTSSTTGTTQADRPLVCCKNLSPSSVMAFYS